jgi:RNA 2',3'-cyclic 3'-phosphodiesterase
MAEMTRTFVAIEVPESLGEVLASWQRSLAPEVAGCHWTDAAQRRFHATLAFLGDVRNRDLNEVCTAVTAAACAFDPFELELRGVGAFPNPKRPRVVWAGLTVVGNASLVELQRAIASAVATTGYATADSDFHAHVTLGRFRPDRGRNRGARPPDVTSVVENHRLDSAGTFVVSEVLTLASSLAPAGSSYRTLACAPLEGKKANSKCLT